GTKVVNLEEPDLSGEIEKWKTIFKSGKEKAIVILLAKSPWEGSSFRENAFLDAIRDLPPEAFKNKNIREAIVESQLLHMACRSFYDSQSTGPTGEITEFHFNPEVVNKNVKIRAEAALHLINHLPED